MKYKKNLNKELFTKKEYVILYDSKGQKQEILLESIRSVTRQGTEVRFFTDDKKDYTITCENITQAHGTYQKLKRNGKIKND